MGHGPGIVGRVKPLSVCVPETLKRVLQLHAHSILRRTWRRRRRPPLPPLRAHNPALESLWPLQRPRGTFRLALRCSRTGAGTKEIRSYGKHQGWRTLTNETVNLDLPIARVREEMPALC